MTPDIEKERDQGEMNSSQRVIAATTLGVIFIVVLLVLAIFYPCPSNNLSLTFKVVLALAAAGFAAILPGAITSKMPSGVSAVGSLAVFVFVLGVAISFDKVDESCPKLFGYLSGKDDTITQENVKWKIDDLFTEKEVSPPPEQQDIDLVAEVQKLAPGSPISKRMRQIAYDKKGPWTPEGDSLSVEIAVLGKMEVSKLYACKPFERGERLKFVNDSTTAKNELKLEVKGTISSKRCKDPPEEPHFFQMNCNDALELFPDAGFTCGKQKTLWDKKKWDKKNFRLLEAYARRVFEERKGGK